MQEPDEMGHTHTELLAEIRKKKVILELRRLNKRADYDCGDGAGGSHHETDLLAKMVVAAAGVGGSHKGILF